jgi:hypothetical protein
MADQKLTALTAAAATLTLTDLGYVVVDPGGTPASRKATLLQLYNAMHGYTPPVPGDFSWVNQGAATLTTTKGWMALSQPPAGGLNLRMLVKTAPATPYTITTASYLNPGEPGQGGVSEPFIGMCFRESGTGEAVTHGLFCNGTVNISADKWDSPTSFGAAYTLSPNIKLPFLYNTGVWWSRLADDGTDRIWSLSADGLNWTVVHQIGRTDFLTANQVGIAIRGCANAGKVCTHTLVSWVEA